MYEAFVVILAAGMIGLLVGIISACLVTAQFYLFLELPFALKVSQKSILLLVPYLAHSDALHHRANNNLLCGGSSHNSSQQERDRSGA